ncbi:MAG: hypothetical protein ACOH5I_11050 [Oligoflexus sp.]
MSYKEYFGLSCEPFTSELKVKDLMTLEGIGGAIPDIQSVHTLKSPDIENLKIKKSQVLNGPVTEFRLAA